MPWGSLSLEQVSFIKSRTTYPLTRAYGPMNRVAFQVYVDPILVLTLRRGDTVILGNLLVHTGADVGSRLTDNQIPHRRRVPKATASRANTARVQCLR